MSLYQVLIVDDEPEIRQGLQLKVAWEELGYRIAGEASNGVEALERLEDGDIDVVLTDMNMPVMDGTSFLDACNERFPALRLIVITGYEDFRYAKAAIRNHARDYLLKPVARDELAETLGKVRKELDDERRDRDQSAMDRYRLSQYYKEMKEHFIIHLVKEEPELSGYVRDRSRLFELDDWHRRPARFMTAGLRPRSGESGDSPRTPDKFRLPFEILCRESAEELQGAAHAFRDANYPGLMHFVLLDEEPDEGRPALADALCQRVKAFMDFELKIGVGQPVEGFQHWKEGYMDALLAWSLPGEGAEESKSPAGPASLPEETVKLIERYLARGELEAFGQAVGLELNEAFILSKSYFVKAIFQLYLILESTAYASEITLESGEQLWLRPEMALGLDTPDKARSFLMRLAAKIGDKRREEADETDAPLIRTARQFIDENYMYDLNLTMIAEKFNYNPSYFSEMFKDKTGKTFIQYLTEVRMAQAIRLLEGTSLGLWDIAELTGFSNASYFSSRFKRMYGVSPSDYRQRSSVKIDSEHPKK